MSGTIEPITKTTSRTKADAAKYVLVMKSSCETHAEVADTVRLYRISANCPRTASVEMKDMYEAFGKGQVFSLYNRDLHARALTFDTMFAEFALLEPSTVIHGEILLVNVIDE